MNPERLQQVERLYHAALERSESERDGFLDHACQSDPTLRRDVETLIAAHERAGSFLAAPAWELTAKAMAAGDIPEARDLPTNDREGGANHQGNVLRQTVSHYRILEVLGEGGMGVVYGAVDTRLNRAVAIKVLRPDAMVDAERAKRFMQEARAASALNHPHIITVYEVDSVDGVDFMAMEYIKGRTLQELLSNRVGLRLRDALKYGAQIADALAAAHHAGIVHRDLKPANVMITERGDAKVLDFGLAKLTDRAHAGAAGLFQITTMDVAPSTEKGTILGTVAYMSPEQAEGAEVDARSDIFSFGSLLYEMLTGQRAFQGQTKLATLSAILQTEPTPASQIVETIPRELDRIVLHCLRKDPDQRFQHLDDVKTLLVALKEESDSGKLVTRSDDRTAVRKRRVTVAGILLFTVAVVGTGWWLAWDRARGFLTGSVSQSTVTTAVSTRPTETTRQRLSSGGPPSGNAEANRLFENAMQLKIVNDVPRARVMLERALALDPRFAEARAWYGFTNWLLLDQGYSNDSALLYSAEDEMRRAAADDPNLARAHMGLAAIYLMQGRKELIPSEAEQALKSNPGDEDVSNILMQFHAYSGDFATARRVGQEVLDRLPLFFPNRMILGELLRQQGDLAGAIREQQKILEQDPQNIYALGYLAHAFMDSGDLGRARETLSRIRPEDRQSYRSRRAWALLLALEGRRGEALKEMDSEVLKWLALVAWETAEAAEFYALLGDTQKALDWLDRAVRNGDERVEFFRRDPLLANIRNHPRFQQILDSIAYRRQQRNSPR